MPADLPLVGRKLAPTGLLVFPSSRWKLFAPACLHDLGLGGWLGVAVGMGPISMCLNSLR